LDRSGGSELARGKGERAKVKEFAPPRQLNRSTALLRPVQDPESIVKSFIADYYRWSERATEFCKARGMEGMLKADVEYTELLSRYCRPDLDRQAIAFNSPPMHDPETESIHDVVTEGERTIVKTTNTTPSGFQDGFENEDDFEYFFVLRNGKWFLEGLDYIDDEGRYPCL
jgi:hypothetical protein